MDKKTYLPHPLSPGARNLYPLTHRACDSEGESEVALVNTDCFNDYDHSLLGNIDPDINYLKSNKKVLNTPYYNDQSVCTFNVLLNNMLGSLHKKHYEFLLGDFNVNFSPAIETTAAVEEFKNIFCSHQLYPLINKPTREAKSSKTIIDNIYCNIPHVLNLSDIGIGNVMPYSVRLMKLNYKITNRIRPRNAVSVRGILPSFPIILKKRLGTLSMTRVHRWHSRGFKVSLICSLTNAFKNGCLK